MSFLESLSIKVIASRPVVRWMLSISPIRILIGTNLLLCSIYSWLALEYNLEKILGKLPNPIWWSTMIIGWLTLSLLGLIVFSWFLDKQIPVTPLEGFVFDKTTGLCSHKKTGELACTNCLLGLPRIQSPLKEMPHGWQCVRTDCSRFYSNPAYEPPPTAKKKPFLV